MAQSKSTSSISHLPISSAVGSVISVPDGMGGSRSAKVPAAGTLVINGVRSPLIDVRAMGAATIAQFINAMGTGAQASIDGGGHLVIANISMLDGEGDLRAFFGI